MSSVRWPLGLAALLFAIPRLAGEDPAAPARAVLERHCWKCHGQNGAAKGGFDYVLDRDRLVSRGKIVLGKPDESELFQRVHKGEMPPEGKSPRPATAEVKVLREWIAAGAPAISLPSRFVTEADLHRIIRADLTTVPDRHRRFIRYFTLAHLTSAARPASEVREARQAVARLLNGLSWHARITVPKPVDAAGTVLRIDLRDYRWTARTWDRLVTAYPYRTTPESDEAKTLARETGADVFVLRGDWFAATASRAPLYYDLLELPVTDRALERLVQVDLARDLREETTLRAGFNESGVSKNNRIIERHDAAYGMLWRSYDFSDNKGRQNIFEFPLGPAAGPTSFKPAGGEVIFGLPNGLHGYMLVDAEGRRVDRAPVEIVSDPKRPDRVVEAGISCMNCHARGFLPKDDQVRPHVEKSRTAFAAEDVEAVKALYAAPAELKKRIEEDNRRFVAALEACGVKPAEIDPVLAVTLRYEATLDLPLAAAEFGLPPEEFARRVEQSPRLRRPLGALRAKGGAVQRQVFEESFALLVREIGPVVAPTETRKSELAFSGHTDAVLCVTLSGDARLAVSGGQDHTIRVWDVATGKALLTLEGHSRPVRAVALSPDGKHILSGGEDRTVRLWDRATGKELKRLTGHADVIQAVAFAPDGQTAVSVGKDRMALVWDLGRGAVRDELAHPAAVLCLAISTDGRRLLTGTAEGKVHLWDLRKGKPVSVWDGHRKPVRSVAFAAKGGKAASGGEDGIVRVWLEKTGTGVYELRGSPSAVLALAFSADGKRLFSAAGQTEKAESFWHVWNVEKGEQVSRQGTDSTVWCVALSSDGSLTLTGGPDRRLHLRRSDGK